MGEDTRIKWTNSTFNPMIGCTNVGPGCDHCYAETLDRNRFSKTLGGGTKEIPIVHWGAGAPRYRTSENAWKKPLLWDRKAKVSGEPHRVFCASMADVFDNEWPRGVHDDLFELIEATPHLTWQLLTKRIGRWRDVVPRHWQKGFPRHVAIGATIVNQAEAARDLPKLFEVPARVRFVSYEPALDQVTWWKWLRIVWSPTQRRWMRSLQGPRLDWIIVGGESGSHARPFRAAWARTTVEQCRAAGVPVFVKQMGAFVVDRNDAGFDGCDAGSWPLSPDGCDPEVEHDIYGHREEYQGADVRVRLRDRAGANSEEWPQDLRVQQFPEVAA